MSDATIKVSAPGKLFLVGEYAVLDGAPALLTAVDRRATVRLSPAAGTNWTLRAPGIGAGCFELTRTGDIPAATDDQSRHDLRVFEACRAECEAAFGAPARPLDIAIDTRAFSADGHKLGLGSSAAVSVTLCQALAIAAGVNLERTELATLAIRSHRRAQGGRGSGGDVAASVHGGLIRYLPDASVTRLSWPSELAGAVVATGAGAETTELVGRVQAYAGSQPADYQRLMQPLVELADCAERAAASVDDFLALCRDYFSALAELDRHAQAGIVTDLHRQLAASAGAHGAVFKSCGAGGGDVGLVFADKSRISEPFARIFGAQDTQIVPLEMNAAGVRIERNGP